MKNIMNQSRTACGIILPEYRFQKTMQTRTHAYIAPVSRPWLVQLRLFSIILLSALAACTTPDWGTAPDTGESVSAEAAFARGDFDQAAEAWQRDAVDAEPRKAASLRVSAADAWLLAGDPSKAEAVLRWVDRPNLALRDQARLDLVLADLALRHNRPDEAELLLQKAHPALPASSQPRYESLMARLTQQLTGPASRDISRAAQISDAMAYYDPRATVELMRVLESVPSGELAIRADNPRAERRITAWLDLALVIRRNLVIPDGIADAVSAWKGRHPHHLLSEEQALDTWLRYRQLFTPPRKIAVLLPEKGRLQAASAAIRDGVMNAYMDNPGGAEILYFQTGDSPQSAISAYFNALDAGVDWIIGPLRKESIEAMLNLAGMATPVLALNDLPDGFIAPAYLAGQVNGISLSQQQETAAVAAHAAAAGFARAIVLAPESAWGELTASAFEAEFLQDDREILAAMRYLESQNDHSAVLQRALKIDESVARKRKLESTLQMPLEFEPSRRSDVDVIFMAANATQAKLIRPQLKFHDAGDIPVYATGRVFSGQPDPARNQDLNGVRFPATPWQLAHATKEEIPRLASLRRGNLGSLFALGSDAWNLLPWLELMASDPDFIFPGQAGFYRARGPNGLRREPAWAEFSRGKPIPLRAPLPTPAPESLPRGMHRN